MATPTVTRFPNGVVDATQDGSYGSYAGLRPFRYHNWTNDFDDYLSGDWVVSGPTTSTQAIGATATGGWLVLTIGTTGATNDQSIQWAGNSGAVAQTFVWESTLDFLLLANFKTSDATNDALIVGLCSTDTTPASSLPTSGIFFTKAAASTSLIASIRIAGVSTSVTLGAMADSTNVEATLFYSADTGLWRAFFNNVSQGTMTAASNTPTATLAVTIGHQNATALSLLSIDNFHAAKQR